MGEIGSVILLKSQAYILWALVILLKSRAYILWALVILTTTLNLVSYV